MRVKNQPQITISLTVALKREEAENVTNMEMYICGDNNRVNNIFLKDLQIPHRLIFRKHPQRQSFHLIGNRHPLIDNIHLAGHLLSQHL
jgi:hypothetical protein